MILDFIIFRLYDQQNDLIRKEINTFVKIPSKLIVDDYKYRRIASCRRRFGGREAMVVATWVRWKLQDMCHEDVLVYSKLLTMMPMIFYALFYVDILSLITSSPYLCIVGNEIA